MRRWAALIASAVGLLLAVAPAEAAPAPSLQEQVARWIGQLGADDFTAREDASQKLWAAGPAAEAALEKALRSDDPEVARRARVVLGRIRAGIPADTPGDVLRLVEQYLEDPARGEGLLDKLLANGSQGYAVLVKVADRQATDQRRRILERITRQGPRLAAALLADGQFDAAEALLESCLGGGDESDRKHYAAFIQLRGKLDDALRRFEGQAGRPGGARAQALLTHLYRAKGDLASARRSAEKAGQQDLRNLILAEQGDWQELARLPVTPQGSGKPSLVLGQYGLRAAQHRLAGSEDESARLLAAIAKGAGDAPTQDVYPWFVVPAFLLNDRLPEAFTLLRQHRDAVREFELLCAQLRFREAFALADRADAAEPKYQFWIQLARVRALSWLGERDKAAEILARMIAADAPRQRFDLLLAEEYRLGLTDRAFADARRLLAAPGDKQWPYDVRPEALAESVLAPQRSYTVDVWWKELRAEHPAPVALEKLRDLLGGKIRGEAFRGFVKDFGRLAYDPARRTPWLEAVAEAALAAGEEELAQKCWQEAAEQPYASGPALHLADFLADKGRWPEAAAWYRRAWEKQPQDGWLFYLHGWALARAGKVEEGRQVMERAHWLPLGDAETRFLFAANLSRLGQEEEADRERGLALGIDTLSYYRDTSNALVKLARAAEARGDFPQAVALHKRVRLLYLEWNVGYEQTGLYLLLPQRVHHQRARALLAAGKIEEALKEARLCLDLVPGSVDLLTNLVPELERSGHKREADELYRRGSELYQGLCKDYPGCAWVHHNLAWLAAGCRRDLDAALGHARKAAELMPQDAGYQDTLAEVHFQRGDTEKAIALVKGCLAQAPQREYFRQQLRRFRAGDPATAVPPDPIGPPKSDEACLLPKDLESNTADGVLLTGKTILRGGFRGNGFSGR